MEKQILKLPSKIINTLEKKHYGIYNHSGVQICSWTKKALRGEGVCYKTKFYGIECHACMEFSPAVMYCQENCSFCWRPMEFMKNIELKIDETNSPKEIIDNLTILRQKLLSGFGGHDNVNRKFWELAQTPTHYAISLSGEPTMYPKLDEMIKYLKTLDKTKSIFVVTNGQEPKFFEKLLEGGGDERLEVREKRLEVRGERLEDEKNSLIPNNLPPISNLQPQTSLPSQLYISLVAPNQKLFDKINKSLYKDGFERLKKSLSIFAKLNTRKVLRITLIKGLNDKEEQFSEFKKLIELSNTDFIEIKGYIHIGMSQNRHKKEDMPTYLEIENFSKSFAKYLGNYELVETSPNSMITLLRKKDSIYDVGIEF